MNNKYQAVEGLLYSYNTIPYKRRNLEIDIKLTDSEEKKQELEMLELTAEKIDNMLAMLKQIDETDYLIIKSRYIDGLSWDRIESIVHISVCQLIARRKKILINVLLPML